MYILLVTKQLQCIFNNSIKINSITLHFKESTKNEFYLTWCSGVSLLEYENKERTLSVFKSCSFICGVTDCIYTNNAVKKEVSNEKRKCPNCNKASKLMNLLEVPFSYLIKYHTYLRSQTTQKQLKMEKDDIQSHVTPILVLEHRQIDQDSFKKKEITQIKIGVKYASNFKLMRNENSDIPTAIKREISINDQKHYSLNLKNKHFLKNTIKVCEECYFLLNDTNLLTRSDLNVKIMQTQMHNQIVKDY